MIIKNLIREIDLSSFMRKLMSDDVEKMKSFDVKMIFIDSIFLFLRNIIIRDFSNLVIRIYALF